MLPWIKIFLCAALWFVTTVHASPAQNALIGSYHGKGLYVFDVPGNISDCSEKIQTRAHEEYSKADQKWREAQAKKNNKVDDRGLIWFRPASVIRVKVPSLIKKLAEKRWLVVRAGTRRHVKLVPFVSAHESFTPCWILATTNWRLNQPHPRTSISALVTQSSRPATFLTAVNVGPRWDKVSESAKSDFNEVVSKTPELAEKISAFFTNENEQAVDWRLVWLQAFNSRFEGRRDKFISAQIYAESGSGSTASVVVNVSKKQLCRWQSGGEEAISTTSVLSVAHRTAGKTDLWIVENQAYEGFTRALVEPLKTKLGCELRTVTETGYSSL